MNILHPTPFQGAECCSDSLIGVHYMSPTDIIRLDIAIEVLNNILKLYDKYVKLGKNVTFQDIFRNYVWLQDFEQNTNYYKNVINS